MHIPTVLDEGHSQHILDLYSRLLKERIIFLFSEINDDIARLLCSQMIFLNDQSDKPINIYINSGGGSVHSAIAIIEVMNLIKCEVHTTVLGFAASAASLIDVSGEKRFMTANSRKMIHQPLGGARGQATDIDIVAKEINLIRTYINNIYVTQSKLSYDVILSLTDRDTYLSSTQCLEYGFIDEIIGKFIPLTPIK